MNCPARPNRRSARSCGLSVKYCVTAWRWRSRRNRPSLKLASQPAPPKPSKIDKKDYTFNLEIVLNDRRPSDELQDYELRRRLEVYRQYDRDERYDEDQRAYWREVRQRDEALLQQRLIRERRQRQAELASQYEDDQYDIELGEGYDPDQQRTMSMPPKLTMRNWKMFSSLRRAGKLTAAIR